MHPVAPLYSRFPRLCLLPDPPSAAPMPTMRRWIPCWQPRSEGRAPSVQYIRFGRSAILHEFRRGKADLSRGAGEGSFVAFNRSGFSAIRFQDRMDRLVPPAPAVQPPVPAIHRSAVRIPGASF